MQPPEQDPYRSMWHMSQIGGTDGRPERRIRWLAGILAGLSGLAPFVLLTTVMWGVWDGEFEAGGGGVAVLLVGLAIGSTLGGYVATSQD
jgi:hypothetical protein